MWEKIPRILRTLRVFSGILTGRCSDEESAYWLNEGICEKVLVPGFLLVGPSVLTYPDGKSYCVRK